jgi:hypothetical protein
METKAGIAGIGDLGSTCIAKMLLIHSRSNSGFTKTLASSRLLA